MGEAVCWAGGMREISAPSTQSAVNLTDKVYLKKKKNKTLNFQISEPQVRPPESGVPRKEEGSRGSE